MDFDPSKENIQPLRGGRNVVQLGMALQAQNSEEYRMQLNQQKEYDDCDVCFCWGALAETGTFLGSLKTRFETTRGMIHLISGISIFPGLSKAILNRDMKEIWGHYWKTV